MGVGMGMGMGVRSTSGDGQPWNGPRSADRQPWAGQPRLGPRSGKYRESAPQGWPCQF